MEHSKNYDKVRGYYNKKLWDVTRVRNAVVKGWITEEEFAEITGAALIDECPGKQTEGIQI